MTTIRRRAERGSAMLVTMIVISSLIAGATLLSVMQRTSTRSAALTRNGMDALHCAEAGLVMARKTVAASHAAWATALAASAGGDISEPAFLASMPHDLDGDGKADFSVYLRDNDDETPPVANDRAIDLDKRVFIVARCIKYADAPKSVTELVQVTSGGTCYESQEGGCGGNANAN